MNLLPAFAPPTWAVLVFFKLEYELAIVPIVVGGALCAASGRLVPAHGSRHFRTGFGRAPPLYELALLIAARFDERRDRRLVVVTAEPEPPSVFGRPASREVARLLTDRHVEVRPGILAEAVDDDRLLFATGGSLPADLVVALPEPTGPRLAGLPHDDVGLDAWRRRRRSANGFRSTSTSGSSSGSRASWSSSRSGSAPRAHGS